MKKSTIKVLGNRGHIRVYDWDRLLDGSVWELSKDTDFSSVASFRTSASAFCRARGLVMASRFDKDSGLLLFQAKKP